MKTMTDSICVNYYVDQIMARVCGPWSGLSDEQRIREMHQIVSEVHRMCEIPVTSFSPDRVKGNKGLFVFAEWKIELNPNYLPASFGYMNDVTEDFVLFAEVLYHEARHCEQWWYMAQYLASQYRSSSFLAHHTKKRVIKLLPPNSPVLLDEGASYLSRKLWIPQRIARLAINSPLQTNDPLFQLTQGWYDSVYGEKSGKRNIVLRPLYLKGNVGHQHVGGLYHYKNETFLRYKELAEEQDAWAIQKRVVSAFAKYRMSFRPPIAPRPKGWKRP